MEFLNVSTSQQSQVSRVLAFLFEFPDCSSPQIPSRPIPTLRHRTRSCFVDVLLKNPICPIIRIIFATHQCQMFLRSVTILCPIDCRWQTTELRVKRLTWSWKINVSLKYTESHRRDRLNGNPKKWIHKSFQENTFSTHPRSCTCEVHVLAERSDVCMSKTDQVNCYRFFFF